MVFVLILLSILPFVYLMTQFVYVGGFLYAFGNVSGLIGTVLMIWQVLLGMRFISQKLTKDLVSNTKLHMRIGKYGMLLVFAHPVIQFLKYGSDIIFKVDFANEFYKHVSLGRFAFIIFVIVWVSSAILRGKLKYRPWLYLHYLNYPMILLVFLHSKNIGTYLGHFKYLMMYWDALFFLFISLVIFRLFKWFNGFKYKFTLVNKTDATSEVVRFEFKNFGDKKIKIIPGQFVFLRKSFFSESHPFTVMDFDTETGDLVFSIKKVGPYTKFLSNLKKGNTVYIDGPYGVFTREGQNNDPKILIAGGIGVTPFYSLVKEFSNKDTYLLYSNKLIKEAIEREFFKSKLGNNYIDFVTQEKVNQNNVEEGRIDSKNILKYINKDKLKASNIFICGPVPFMNAVKATLIELGVSKSKIFTEEFSL